MASSADRPGLAPARVLPCGEAAVLVEVADTRSAIALARQADARRRAGSERPGDPWALVGEVVPGERTVLVVLAGPAGLRAVRSDLAALAAVVTAGSAAETTEAGPLEEVLEIDVVYDGPDLAVVARHTGLTVPEVIAAHTGRPWTVGFTGFAPGFGYLVDGDPRLTVPRLADPRPRVPAGSVALAGGYSGIYPTASPGGWQLIGRTSAVLWDSDRRPPALLRPGLRLRFRAVGEPA